MRHRAAPLAVLGVALLLAAFMRLYRPDLARLGADQVWHLRQARLITTGQGFPAYGLGTSAGFRPPALADYLLAPAALLGPRLEPMTLFLGGLGLLGWLVTCLLLWRHFGPWAAAVGGSLYAASLWAAFFARVVNGDTFIPLFNALLGWSVLEVLRRGSRAHMVLAPVWLSAAVQSHYAALSLAAPAALALLLGRGKVRAGPLLLGVMLGLAVAGPYWVVEAKQGFPGLRALASASVGGVGAEQRPQLEAWTLTQHLTRISDLGPSMGHPMGDVFFGEPAWALRLREVQNLLILASVAILLISAARPHRPLSRQRVWLWTAGWYLLPPAVASLASVQVQIHGLTVVYPSAYVVVGAAAGILREEVGRLRPARRIGMVARRIGVVAGGGLIGLICLVQVAAWPRFLGWLDQVGSPLVGLLWSGWMRTEEQMAPLLRRGQPLALALPYDLREAGTYVLEDDYRVRTVDPQHHLVIPEGGELAYVTESSEAQFLVRLDAAGARHLASFPYALGQRSLELYRLTAEAAEAPARSPGMVALDWRLINGVEFLAYRALPDGGGVRVELLWKPGSAEGLGAHSLFFHLLDEAGEAHSKVDFAAPALEAWGPAIVLSYATLPIPHGEASPWFLSVGMYTSPGIEGVRGGAGRDPPTAPDLRIPLAGLH